MQVALDKVLWDEDLYPRVQYDWKTAHEYAEAMKSGSVFPPIEVVEGDEPGIYIGLDGRHRYEAHKRNKTGTINVRVVDVSKERRFFYAVECNIKHGRRLSPFEKIRIAQKLQEHKFSLVNISKVLHMPKNTLSKLLNERQSAPKLKDGKVTRIPLKSPITHMAGEDLSDKAEAAQRRLAAGSQAKMLNEMAALMEADIIDLSSEEVLFELVRIWRWLQNRRSLFSTKKAL